MPPEQSLPSKPEPVPEETTLLNFDNALRIFTPAEIAEFRGELAKRSAAIKRRLRRKRA